MENRVYHHKSMHQAFIDYDWNSSQSDIDSTNLATAISEGKPMFIGRYGSVELRYFLRFLAVHKLLRNTPRACSAQYSKASRFVGQ